MGFPTAHNPMGLHGLLEGQLCFLLLLFASESLSVAHEETFVPPEHGTETWLMQWLLPYAGALICDHLVYYLERVPSLGSTF
jgi:hypothetical protein